MLLLEFIDKPRPEEAVVGGHDETVEDEGSLGFVVPKILHGLV